jgi:anti-anti-sigma regulatory factor
MPHAPCKSPRIEPARLAFGVAPAKGPLTLDLSRVPALTAADLGQLVSLHNRMASCGGRLVLVNAGPLAFEVLEITRLTNLFEGRLAV